MNPIRVSFVIDNLSRAGTESQLLALIRSLDRSAVTPSLVLLDGDNVPSRDLEPAECEVLRLGVTKLVSPAAARAANRLRKYWATHRPDVVVAYFLDSAYFSMPIATWAGARTVRVRNNLGYWLTAKHRVLGKVLRPFVDSVLTNSDEGRAALIAEGTSSERIAVIENGVDLERFPNPRPVDVTKSFVRVGCVANLRSVKNIDGLIRAAKAVCERFPAVHFDVAGDGEQCESLQRQIDDAGLRQRFTLHGSVAGVPAFLASCELAVLPSHSEGMPNALLEYLAAGRAVVATDVGANRRVVGDAGVIVPPGDDNALSAAIESFLAQPEEAIRLGRRARELAETHFSRNVMVKKFEMFFRTLTTTGRAAVAA